MAYLFKRVKPEKSFEQLEDFEKESQTFKPEIPNGEQIVSFAFSASAFQSLSVK